MISKKSVNWSCFNFGFAVYLTEINNVYERKAFTKLRISAHNLDIESPYSCDVCGKCFYIYICTIAKWVTQTPTNRCEIWCSGRVSITIVALMRSKHTHKVILILCPNWYAETDRQNVTMVTMNAKLLSQLIYRDNHLSRQHWQIQFQSFGGPSTHLISYSLQVLVA